MVVVVMAIVAVIKAVIKTVMVVAVVMPVPFLHHHFVIDAVSARNGSLADL
jgi:hypothetical protein